MKKKSNNQLIPVFLLIIFSISIGYPQNLNEIFKLTLENNPRIKAQEQLLYKSNLESKVAFRESLPSITFDASYSHITDVAEIDLPTNSLFPGGKIQLGTYDKYETGITAQYVLFSGFAQKNNITLKKQLGGIQEISLEKLKKEVLFDVSTIYRQVQAINLQLQILESAKKRIQLQMQRTTVLVEQGMILSLDTLSISLAVLDFDKRILKTQSDRQLLLQKLEITVGKKVTVNSGLPLFENEPLPSFYESGMEDLALIGVQNHIAETSIRLNKSAYYPMVAMMAAYKYGKPGVDVISNEWMHYGVWGVNLSWNLFRGQADKLKVDAAKAEKKRIFYTQQSVDDGLKLVYLNACNEYEYLLKQKDVAEKAIKIASEKMRVVKSHYEQGIATVTDFNLANLEYTESELSRSGLLLQLIMKRNEIEYKSGQPIHEWSIGQ